MIKKGFVLYEGRNDRYWGGHNWVEDPDNAKIYENSWRAIQAIEDSEVERYVWNTIYVERVVKTLETEAQWSFSTVREELDGGYKNDEHSRD